MKTNCGAKWFIDGENYFEYLLEQLKNAKESVFITDWFLSPELALKRPINYKEFIDKNNEFRKKLNFSNVYYCIVSKLWPYRLILFILS